MADLVKKGLNYPGPDGKEKRAEPGDVVSDIREEWRADLIAQGAIEPLAEAPKPRRKAEKE